MPTADSSKNGFPVVILVGISGVGKSELARQLELDHRWLHINVDEGGGFEKVGLARGWGSLEEQRDGAPLAHAVIDRARSLGKVGAVLSLPSDCMMHVERVRAADAGGLKTIVLWGDWELCKTARRARDQKAGDPPVEDERYERINKPAYDTYGSDDFLHLRVDAFGPDDERVAVALTARAVLRSVWP